MWKEVDYIKKQMYFYISNNKDYDSAFVQDYMLMHWNSGFRVVGSSLKSTGYTMMVVAPNLSLQ